MENPPRRESNRQQEIDSSPFDELAAVSHEQNYEKPRHSLSYISPEARIELATSLRAVRMRPYHEQYISKIEGEVNAAVQDESANEYLTHLEQSWQATIDENEKIDTFLCIRNDAPFAESWSEAELEKAQDMLQRTLKAEHSKNVYSGALKRKIEYEAEKIRHKYSMSDEEFNLLLTPKSGSFHDRYRLDHLEYYLDPEGYGQNKLAGLLGTYHDGDCELFELRLKSFNFENTDNAQLRASAAQTRERLKDVSIKKGYLMQERPDVAVVDRLLEYDNWEEFIHICTYKAFPEAILREKLLEHAQYNLLADKNARFTDYTHDEFIALVEQMHEEARTAYNVEVKPYRQTDDTCGTACVLTLLRSKGKEFTQDDEMQMWSRIGRPFNFPGGIAQELMQEGFNVKYSQYPSRSFYEDHPDINDNPDFFFKTAGLYMQQLKEATTHGLDIAVADWNFETIIENLKSGNLSIVGINIGEDRNAREMLHWVLATGYRLDDDGYKLYIIDPLGRDRYVDKRYIDWATPTSMGKRLITIRKMPEHSLDIANSENRDSHS